MSDSWESFAAALADESVALMELHTKARELMLALIDGDPTTIVAADRAVNGVRQTYMSACGRRRGMQVRGFGTMTLRQVCQYAPRQFAGPFNQRLAELTYASIQLGITLKNNKALIASGMERLVNVTGKLQEHAAERTGVYRRRGRVRPGDAAVIVSSRV